MSINISQKYSKFQSKSHDEFRGYEAGFFDGQAYTFDTIAMWIEQDVEAGRFDVENYINVLRRRAEKPFTSVV